MQSSIEYRRAAPNFQTYIKGNHVADIDERLFEFRDGKSDKFWKITLSGTSHTVTYGRVGTDGQTKTKEFDTDDEAQKSYDKLVAQKTKKGYAEVDAGESRSAKVKDSKEQAAAHEPFLQAIQDDPENVNNYLVYSDWLIEHGEPLGDFIRLQIRLEEQNLSAADRKSLAKQEKALLEKHERDFVGEGLAPYFIDGVMPEETEIEPEYQHEFRRGFIHTVNIALEDHDFCKAFAKASLPLLHTIVITDVDYNDDEGECMSLLARGKYPSVKELRFGDWSPPNAINIEKLLKKLSALETLQIESTVYDGEGIMGAKLPQLKSLHLEAGYDHPLDTLGKNSSMGSLEQLTIRPHMLEPGHNDPYVSSDSFEEFCKSKKLKSLKSITIFCTEIGCEGIEQLIKAPFFSQLEYLDLSNGTIRREGAAALARQDLSNFKKINLDSNMISIDPSALFEQIIGSKYSPEKGEEVAQEFLASEHAGEIDPDSKEHLWEGSME